MHIYEKLVENNIFDKLIKNNIPYIIPYNDLITNQNREIYLNASRIEYLFDNDNNEIFDLVKENNITLEFSFSKIQELNFGINIYNLVERLFRDNINISINSLDMTILNTNICTNFLCTSAVSFDMFIDFFYKVI